MNPLDTWLGQEKPFPLLPGTGTEQLAGFVGSLAVPFVVLGSAGAVGSI